jgi:hypothetical protein
VAWLARAVWENRPARKRLGWSVSILVLFVSVQLVLGVEAWLNKYSQGLIPESEPPLTRAQVAIRTAHFLLGSCILAAAVVTIVLARLAPVPALTAEPSLRPAPRPHLAVAGMSATPRPEGTP